MPTALDINDILSQVKNLDKESQFTLLERLVALVRRHRDIPKKPSLLSLSGIGAEIWKDTDIDQYIDEERQW